ncbi:Mannose-P-dolichol utilization defect 1 protein-like [Armadillidium vulgare]|nr:Mannose-P-dolichol utilization defect 1 protein-like [Armadillidium vulgare]
MAENNIHNANVLPNNNISSFLKKLNNKEGIEIPVSDAIVQTIFHQNESFLDNEAAVNNTTFELSTSTIKPNNDIDHICKKVLYIEVGYSRVRVWDLLLLIPVVLFFLGLLFKLNSARLKLRAVHSPIYATFYCLIWLNTIVALIRCVVSMTVNAATTSGDEANILLYVTVRFFLLATEISVVVFAIFFGHLDNRTSIRRVLLVTSMIVLPYSIVQGLLELLIPDPDFYIISKDYYLFGHGVYWFILILRLDYLRKKFLFLLWMPMKKAFYVYLSFLAILNTVQSIGSGLYHAHYDVGLCIVDFTTWTYFSLLTPFIYYTFIYQFFRKKSPDQIENIVFSYKSEDEDTASIPPTIGDYQNAISGFQTTNPPYSSLTEEDGYRKESSSSPVNNVYNASVLQSPDSLTGYSINSCDSITITAYENA